MKLVLLLNRFFFILENWKYIILKNLPWEQRASKVPAAARFLRSAVCLPSWSAGGREPGREERPV